MTKIKKNIKAPKSLSTRMKTLINNDEPFSTTALMEALKILSDEIESDDKFANAVLLEAAKRLDDLMMASMAWSSDIPETSGWYFKTVAKEDIDNGRELLFGTAIFYHNEHEQPTVGVTIDYLNEGCAATFKPGHKPAIKRLYAGPIEIPYHLIDSLPRAKNEIESDPQ